MRILSKTRICLVPRLVGLGGMVSFQHRLAQVLIRHGIEVCFDLNDEPYRSVLIVGGTHNLRKLRLIRRKGVHIVQRLDGMNWLHRVRFTSVRHFLRAEYGNLILRCIRSRLADTVVYQSQFVRRWWESKYGSTDVPSEVIYNGVDLNVYSPCGVHNRPLEYIRLLMVEGNVMGGYEFGLENAVNLIINLAKHPLLEHRHVEMMVVGRVEPSLQAYLDQQLEKNVHAGEARIKWEGVVAQDLIPSIDRSAHLFYSADINAACPNSVIESLACGTPVVAFDTGSLSELVEEGSGKLVPYGGNPWKLDKPDIQRLTKAAVDILYNQEPYRLSARAWAEKMFDLDTMAAKYLDVLTAF